MDYKFFKTNSIGGFDKKEVLDYIQQISVENTIGKERLGKELKDVKANLEEVINENNYLKNKIEKIVEEKKQVENDKKNISDKIDSYKRRHNDIANILLDIEEKKRLSFEEIKSYREEVLNEAKIEAKKIVDKANEFSIKTIRDAEMQYMKTMEATIELAKLIDNSRDIYNKISDETISLIKENKNVIDTSDALNVI